MNETDLFRNKAFTDPSSLAEIGLDKRKQKSADFGRKTTRKHKISPSIKESLKSRDLFTSNNDDGDRTTLLMHIKECGKEKNLSKAKRIHYDVVMEKEWLQKDVRIATALLTVYAKCGELRKAEELFEQMGAHDVVSWNALITAYVRHGLAKEAIECFGRMQDEGIRPNPITFTCILKACSILGSLHIGEDIDAQIRKQGLLGRDVVLGTALVDMYSKCGALEKARHVFEHLPARNVVSWTAIITGYTQQGFGHEALKCFRQMQESKVIPNAITYISILKACGMTGSLAVGEKIDAEVRKQGLVFKDITLGNSLVAMYVKCGALEKARQVFEQVLPNREDVVSWNVLIDGYTEHGLGDEALRLFKRMQGMGVYPDLVTYVCILKTCGILGLLEMGRNIDIEIRKQGLLKENVVLATSLMDMYSSCGALEKSEEVFEGIQKKDVVAWNALISAYVENGHSHKALDCFRKMHREGVSPSMVTYISVLKACGLVGSLEIGEEIDVECRRKGLPHKDVVLGTAIVDMYCKCGSLEKAAEVFKLLPLRNVVAWTALISGYAQAGQADMALQLYARMRGEGVVPNSVTFVVLLTACSHAGQLEAAEQLLGEMRGVYHVAPSLEHHACMIDVFGRAGCLNKAKTLVDKLPAPERLPLFLGILGACHKWRDVSTGRWAFQQCVELDATCGEAYVCMENIFVAAGMHGEAGGDPGVASEETGEAGGLQDAATNKVHSFHGAEDHGHAHQGTRTY